MGGGSVLVFNIFPGVRQTACANDISLRLVLLQTRLTAHASACCCACEFFEWTIQCPCAGRAPTQLGSRALFSASMTHAGSTSWPWCALLSPFLRFSCGVADP